MRTRLLVILLALCLAPGAVLSAQDYQNTPVTVSKEKVRSGGKVYYSHIVLERQTLFSISKAYGVTVQDIYDANPTLDLRNTGLKKNQIILIPTTGTIPPAEEAAAEPQAEAAQAAPEAAQPAQARPEPDPSEYTVHTVKWFEDLGSIARKYGTTEDILIAYNGLESRKVSRRQKIRIPKNPAAVAVVTPAPGQADVPADPEDPEAQAPEEGKTLLEELRERAEDMLNVRFRDYIRTALVLPLGTRGSTAINENNFDFYSGVLLAVSDLKSEGINVELNVYDASGGIPTDREIYRHNDLVIGPVSPADIRTVLESCPENRSVVSPLDPRAGVLADSLSNVIQAPSSTEAQYADMVRWIQSDRGAGDRILLITEKNARATAVADYLQASGLPYETLNYGLLEGRDVTASLTRLMTDRAVNRVVIASDSEAFVNDVVRNLGLMVFQKYDVVLYAPSRFRNFETIEVDNYHNVKLHVSMSYYVDYDKSAVKHFLLSYRALFGAEPTPFAYQGYDTAYYFLSRCARGGSFWENTLEDNPFQGLQSDFVMRRNPAGGYTNTAVRRIVYGENYTITAY
ncbi:MAG: LysM peptidoglycan-binding domain-containing protein [Bacteroidales bacterium]|nr:LysM peptidoglycan-binding domain-containing protein [Bacteroidales bacterium]